MATSVYSGLDMILTINSVITGSVVISGVLLAEDTFKFTPAGDIVTTKQGMEGSVGMNVSNDRSGTLTVKMLATHADNDLLSTCYQSLLLGGSVPLINLHLVKSGGDFTLSGDFLIQKMPELSFGTEMPVMEWSFISGRVDYNPGNFGNI